MNPSISKKRGPKPRPYDKRNTQFSMSITPEMKARAAEFLELDTQNPPENYQEVIKLFYKMMWEECTKNFVFLPKNTKNILATMAKVNLQIKGII